MKSWKQMFRGDRAPLGLQRVFLPSGNFLTADLRAATASG